MLWTEKYRPYKIEQLIGQDKFANDLQNWVTMPNVLLYGPAGVGKTAAANVIGHTVLKDDMKANFFEINASDDRKLETVRTTIKEVAMSLKVGDAPHKIILLDEMDGMTPDAQNALKRIMERYSDNCRFIITCNHRHKIIAPLQSRCANYRFTALSNDEIKKVLIDILQMEGKPLPHAEDFDTFISTLQGDIRRGITELQASVNSNTPLTMLIERTQEPYVKILDSVLNKDYNGGLKELQRLVYLSVDMKAVCQNLHDVFLKAELPPAEKFKYLRVIGEAEWRSSNMTPKILASWMIGQMI